MSIKSSIMDFIHPAAVFRNGFLDVPKVKIEGSGITYRAILKLIDEQPLRFEVVDLTPPLPRSETPPAIPEQPEPNATFPSQPAFQSFRCNICGMDNHQVALPVMTNREAPSCRYCRSNLRMRSIIYALSMELFGRNITLFDMPHNKSLRGAGMSDWEEYAKLLAHKFHYTNTFYHAEPRLDILNILPQQEHSLDFLISSDVFEHIPPPVSRAFDNSLRLLKPGGIFLITVPLSEAQETVEHFPELHDFHFVTTNNKRFLYNRTRHGEEQIYDELIFHGGDGFTLEMRIFSETDLCRQLTAAGFSDIHIYREKVPEFGIAWFPDSGGMPVTARRNV